MAYTLLITIAANEPFLLQLNVSPWPGCERRDFYLMPNTDQKVKAKATEPLPVMQRASMRNNAPPTDEKALRAKMEAAGDKMELLLCEDLGVTA